MNRVPRRIRDTGEIDTSVAITVFWLLCVLSAVAAEIVVVGTWVLGRFWESEPLQMIHNVARFVAVVTGLLGVLVVPAVLRLRKHRPPQSAIYLAFVVAAAGLAMAVI